MTDNLPAVPEPPRQEIDVDSWVEVAKPIFALASRIYDTEFCPKGLRGSEPAVAAAMLYGREIGLPPLTSLGGIHVIEGKPGLSAEQMRAMVFAAGHEIEFTESTGATCTIRGRRRGQERWTAVTWTIDMARAAGLGGKHIWKTYPRTQLQARATTELARMIFPDVIHGFRSVEELDDMGEANGTEAAPGAPVSGTSKVSRARRTTRKRAEPAPPKALDMAEEIYRRQDAEASGPPLPGEPGYEDTPTGPSTPESGRGVPTSAGEGETDSETRDSDTGEDSPSPAPPSEGEESPGDLTRKAGGPGETATPPPPTYSEHVAREHGLGAPDDPETPQHDDDEPRHPVGPRKPSRAQMRMLWGTLGGFGLTGDDEREERLLVATTILGREVETFEDLAADECKTLIDALAMVTPPNDRAALNRLLDQYDADKLAIAEQNEEDGKS